MNFSSRPRVLGVIGVVGLLAFAVLVGVIEYRLIPDIEREYSARVEVLPILLATANQRDLITKDLASLNKTLEQTVTNLGYAGLRYVLIQDLEGKILAESFSPQWTAADREEALLSLRLMSVAAETTTAATTNVLVDLSTLSAEVQQALGEGGSERTSEAARKFADNMLPVVHEKSAGRFENGEQVILDLAYPITTGRVGFGAVRVGIVDELADVVLDLRSFTYSIAAGALIIMFFTGLIVANVIDGRFVDELNAKVAAQQAVGEEAVRRLEAAAAAREESHPISPSEFLALLDVARKLGASLDYNEVLEIGMHAVLQLMNVRDVSIFVLDPAANELVGRVGHDENGDVNPAELAEIRIPVGKGDIGLAAEFGTTTIIDTPRPGSATVAALVARGRTIGVVVVRNKTSGRAFNKKDQTLIRILAGLIANSMDTAAIVHHLGGNQS